MTLAWLAAALRMGLPYALASLGGMWSERSGVIQIALEGILLGSAFCATLGAYTFGSAWAGLACGAASGALLALFYGLCVVVGRGDQIVVGIAINLLVDGACRLFLKLRFGSSSNSPRVAAWEQFSHPALLFVGLTLLFTVGSWLVLGRTRFGLRVRAVGEHPAAARSLGVRPGWVRLCAVVLGGAITALGGVWLAADQFQFVSGMSNGRGYIALAALILGKWRPTGVLLAAFLFGAAVAMEVTLQSRGIGLPLWLVQMFPYVITLLVLAGFTGRAVAPSALGKR